MPEIRKGFLIGFLLIALNFSLHGNIYQLLITVIEVSIVVYLIILSKLTRAYLLHIFFTITTTSVPLYTDQARLYNYSKFEILGPVSISQLITLFFFISVISNFKFGLLSRHLKDLIFWFYVSFSGILFGIIGLLYFDYYLQHFISYTVYVIYLIISMLTALHYVRKLDIKKLRNAVFGILASAPLASLFVGLFGILGLYGNKDVYVVNELGYYSFILLPILIREKFNFLLLLGVIGSCFILIDGGTGGKGIIFILLVVIYSYYWILRGNYYWNWFIGLIFRIVPPVVGVGIYLNFAVDNYGLFLYKLESIWISIKNIGTIDNLMIIPNSPRIRVVSIINIWKEGMLNPLRLLFGAGFGSYFHDFTNILSRSDLSDAFRTLEIQNGRYGRPHDMPAAVPLANGLLGLLLLLQLAFKYLKRVSRDPLNLSVYPFLLLSFYYNHQFALVGILLLIISDEGLRRANIT